MDALPGDFARMTMMRSGAVGRAWLDRLPGILDGCARRWGLTLGPPMMPLSYNYVVPARCADGTAAILKICVPQGEFARQEAALRLFDGDGVARLLACVRGD
jgi:streptomycin 6-kinase